MAFNAVTPGMVEKSKDELKEEKSSHTGPVPHNQGNMVLSGLSSEFKPSNG